MIYSSGYRLAKNRKQTNNTRSETAREISRGKTPSSLGAPRDCRCRRRRGTATWTGRRICLAHCRHGTRRPEHSRPYSLCTPQDGQVCLIALGKRNCRWHLLQRMDVPKRSGGTWMVIRQRAHCTLTRERGVWAGVCVSGGVVVVTVLVVCLARIIHRLSAATRTTRSPRRASMRFLIGCRAGTLYSWAPNSRAVAGLRRPR